METSIDDTVQQKAKYKGKYKNKLSPYQKKLDNEKKTKT